jgi:hypothetical protein
MTARDSRGLVSSNVAQTAISVVDPAVRVNYALFSRGGTATGSSDYPNGGYPATSAINDERTGGNWGGGAGGWNDGTRDLWPDSLEVAFNGAKTIDEIHVFTLQNDYKHPVEPDANTPADFYGIIDFGVQYWNGSDWVTIPGGDVTGNDKAMRVFTFPAITTTKIRVVIDNARSNWSRIVELEAIGAGGQ